MKYAHLILIALLATSITACQDNKPAEQAQAPTPETTIGQTEQAQAQAPAGMTQQLTGTVVETMNTAGYTYVKVQSEDTAIWAAAPEFKVAVGDSVIVPEGMAMPNYHSNTLNRDFDVLYFVSSILVPGGDMSLNGHSADDGHDHGAMGSMADGAMGHSKPAASEVAVDLTGLTKAENGYTIAEIFAQQADLATQEVTIRAKVVKFSSNIMKTNWIHLQDGTGEAGTNDLTITTSAQAGMGDTVLVKGILDLNQDFGYGYKYDVIIQDAQVTVE